MLPTPSSGTELVLWLLGGIALLLWGMRMVRTGVQRGFGDRLRQLVGRWIAGRLQAAAAGLGITLFLQSSMATCLLVGSFAGRGVVPLSIALAVMLGADLGTALVAQVLSYDLTLAVPALIFLGLVIFLVSERRAFRNLGRILLGLGLLLLALRLIVGAAGLLQQSALAATVLGALAGEPLLAVLIAALFAWLTHSSLATILMLASLAMSGGGDSAAFPPELLLAFVLGANLGGAVAPYLASIGEPPAMRRVALGNLAFKAVGVIVALLLIPSVLVWLEPLSAGPDRLVVNFHTLFNLALVCVFLPLTGPAGALLERVLVAPAMADETAEEADCLEEEDLTTPKLALANASRAVLSMAGVLERMLEHCARAARENDSTLSARLSALDDVLDDTHERVKSYLSRLRAVPLEEEESRRATETLAFMANLEHAGDILDKMLADTLRRKAKRGLNFSPEGQGELDVLGQRVVGNLRLAMNVFVTSDVALARTLVAEKEVFSRLEREAAESHYERLGLGQVDSIETSAFHLDMLRDLKRVNSHFCAAAYPILDDAGALRRTRLKKARAPQPAAETPAPATRSEPSGVPDTA